MSRKFTSEEMLKSYRNLLDHTDGIEREGIEFSVEMLESELKMDQHQIFNTILPQNILSAKVYKEEEIQKKMRLKIENKNYKDKCELQMLEESVDFIEQKLYFYRTSLNFKEFSEKALTESKSITGSIILDVRCLRANPVFAGNAVKIYIDNVLKVESDLQHIKKEIICVEQAKDFEMIIFGDNKQLLSILFFPCEYFVTAKNILYRFKMYNAYMNALIGFEAKNQLIRKHAKVFKITKKGHDLSEFTLLGPHYCGVCRKMIEMFKPAFKCTKCFFACHKSCSDIIFFTCAKKTIDQDLHVFGRVGFHIEHDLAKDESYGLSWCMHCGLRICYGDDAASCQVCQLKFHDKCAGNIFPDCQMPFELRQSTSETVARLELPPIKCEVNIDDFELIKVIGRGSFGKVFLAKHKKSQTHVALKMLKKEAILNENTLPFLELERAILKKISEQTCNFLMKMTHCFQDESRIYFATEYLSGGDLLHLLSKKVTLPDKLVKQFACEILLGLEHLHNHNIVFRDFKLDNILISSEGHAKIADFGLAKTEIDSLAVTYTLCGTIDTMAPEIFSGKGYTRVVDYWSLGCVIYSMCEGLPVFNGATDSEIIHAILNDGVVFNVLNDSQTLLKDLITKLLTKDPKDRLGSRGGTDEIKKHPYFNVNWAVIEASDFVSEFIPEKNISDNFDQQFVVANPLMSPAPSFIKFDGKFQNFQ